MSTLFNPTDAMGFKKFIEEMRALGATHVSVAGITVEFADAPAAIPVPAETVTTDPKKAAEQLLYSSSD